MAFLTVGVHILSLPFYADKLFEYYVPSDLCDDVKIGSAVIVPFGGSNKHMHAIVFATSSKEEVANIKPIDSVNFELTLTDEELRLADFIKEHNFCSIADAIKLIIPPEAFTKLTLIYTANPPDDSRTPVNKNAGLIYTEILQTGPISAEKALAKFGDGAEKMLAKLCEYGYLEKITEHNDGINKKYDEYIHLCVSDEDFDTVFEVTRGSKLKSILSYLKEHGVCEYSELREQLDITRAQIDNLCEKGHIRIEKIDSFRNPYLLQKNADASFKLSDEQQAAFEKIASLIDTNEPKAALLHGVTGSGKTMVIKSAIDKVIAAGNQVIMLVPEIALTPQSVAVFSEYYGDRVAVIHSNLSRGERYDTWRRIRAGQIDLCIGTRSAIFAPMQRLGMIVIDEEHEHTYKSDQTPKYHAKDIARFRCNYNNALMLLSSATPSVESYYKAKTGSYTLVELKNRYGVAKLPQTIICDLRLDSSKGNLSPVGSLLEDAVGKTLEKGDQSILFVNRRGYNNYLSCPLCGNVVTCPHCSVALTYHAKGRRDKDGYLVCHYCGYRESLKKNCPECGSDTFNYMGFGTQKAEDVISEKFPNAKIMRMDADSASGKFAVDKLLNDFKENKADILVGTQMVTKGHNFPSVTLVGVLLADNSLYLSDYRASERTFALITQVIGRAGRAEKEGVAIIQTYSPEHPVLMQAAAQNYIEFYENEIAVRKSLVFPPFCDIAMITLTSSDEGLLTNTANTFTRRIGELASEKFSDVKIVVFGPFEAPVYKLNEVYRLRYIIKCKSNKSTRRYFSALLDEFSRSAGKKISISIDINPSSL